MERTREPRFDHVDRAADGGTEHDRLRASDADRQRVVDRLGTAVQEGRIGLDEYDERLAAAYAARTYGELAPLTADLPPPTAETRPPARVERHRAPQRRDHGGRLRGAWRPWAIAGVITTGIWFADGVADGGFDYFWPAWVIGPWGLVLLLGGTAARRGWRGCRC